MELQELLDICQILYVEKTSLMVTLKLPKHLTCTHVGKVCLLSSSTLCIIQINTRRTQGVLHFKSEYRRFPTGPSFKPPPSLSRSQSTVPATPGPNSHQRKPSIHFTNQTLQPPTPSINTNITPRTPTSTLAAPHAPLTLKIKPPSAAATTVPPQTPTASVAVATPKTTNRKKRGEGRGAGPTPARDEGGQAKAKKIKTEAGAAAGGGGDKKSGTGAPIPMMPPQAPTPAQKMVVPLKIKLKLNPGKGAGGSGGG